MKNKRVRIALLAIHPYPSPQAVPLANALLKGYAQSRGVEIVLHEAVLGVEPTALARTILAAPVAAVGVSLYVWNRATALATVAALRRLRPELLLFAGGPEATADPQRLLASSALDAVVVGEGEEPFAALCDRLAAAAGFSAIPGVLLRGAEADFVPQRRAVDLAAIPSPWLSGVLDAGTAPGVLWQLARGCTFGCDFCYDARDRFGVRRLPLERVEAELRHFAARGVRQVFVLDSTFNQDLPRAKAILRLIAAQAPGIHFHFEVRSEFLDRELAQLFAAIPCSLQIGLQSADPAVLKGVGRTFGRDDFVARVGLLNASGATFGLDLMIGLPGDTPAGFRASLDFALGFSPYQLDLFPLALLPDTPLATRAAALGVQHLAEPPYTVLATPDFPAEALRRARQLATACDLFYSRGKAVAWFNGVLRSLATSPAAFLEDFAGWLERQRGAPLPEPARCSDEEVWQWQRAYLAERFSGRLQRLRGVILDLVDYHHHYAQVVQGPAPAPVPTPAQLDRLRLLDIPWRLAAGVRLVPFRYDILALLAAGEPDPKRFARHFPPMPGHAALYRGGDGVRTEALHDSYVALLRRLDGRTPAGAIATRLKIPPDAARAFLRFAAGEGLVVR